MGRAAPLSCPGGEVRSCSLWVAALLALAWTSHLSLSLTPRNLALARARLAPDYAVVASSFERRLRYPFLITG